MANHLKMAQIQAILALRARGWSYRRIARELGVHRETVSRYVRQSGSDSKPANPPTGSSSKPAKPAHRVLGPFEPVRTISRVYFRRV